MHGVSFGPMGAAAVPADPQRRDAVSDTRDGGGLPFVRARQLVYWSSVKSFLLTTTKAKLSRPVDVLFFARRD